MGSTGKVNTLKNAARKRVEKQENDGLLDEFFQSSIIVIIVITAITVMIIIIIVGKFIPFSVVKA